MEIKYFVIKGSRGYLRYWFDNNNFYGKVKDIIGFSYCNFFIFSEKEEAEEKIKSMREEYFKMGEEYFKMEGEIKLSWKIENILNKLKVEAIYK